MDKVNYSILRFDELTIHQLYELMAFRQEVFVVEQNCPYQDADFKDQESIHVLGRIQNDLVAYTRLVPKGISYENYHAIGRVITAQSARGKGIGEELMIKSIEAIKSFLGDQVKISAQVYAIPFYEKVGFYVTGKPYLEDGIPHTAMILA